MDYLKFEDIRINRRQYYTADFRLPQNSGNQNHTHDFYEVITITSGEFVEYSSTGKYHLKKGWVHFIKPADRHFLVTAESRNNILRNIVFEREFFGRCLEEIGLPEDMDLFRPFSMEETALQQFQEKVRLLDRIDKRESFNEYILKSILYDFVLSSLFFEEQDHHIPHWLKSCYRDIQKEENFVLGIPRLVELSGKSQEHLTRQLKKYYRITPTSLINNLRIQKAASMLCLTDRKILDIAMDCGFENLSYFNRLFLEKYGKSPRQYRDIQKYIL